MAELDREWLVLSVEIPDPELGGLIAEGLIEYGGTAVAQEGERLTTYIRAPLDPDRLVDEVTRHLHDLLPGHQFEVEVGWQEDEDWEERWRRGLQPRRMGERLLVTPSWIEPELRPGDLLIVIDPEMAFGSGEHATTRGALRALESLIRPGDRVLDVGTGSGILSIAAAHLGAKEILAVESDPDAIENAHDNLVRNGVEDRVDLVHGLVDDEFLSLYGPGHFDLIVANILSSVLTPLLPAFSAALLPRGDQGDRGRLILGGILDHEAEDLISAAQANGFELLVEDLEEEWWGGSFARIEG